MGNDMQFWEIWRIVGRNNNLGRIVEENRIVGEMENCGKEKQFGENCKRERNCGREILSERIEYCGRDEVLWERTVNCALDRKQNKQL